MYYILGVENTKGKRKFVSLVHCLEPNMYLINTQRDTISSGKNWFYTSCRVRGQLEMKSVNDTQRWYFTGILKRGFIMVYPR